MKDEVLTDLLPRAFARPSRIAAYLDLSLGWLVVDSSSRKNAEAVVSAIREALGSVPALPVNAESSPRAIMTGWIGGEPMPDAFMLGDECELRDPVDAGAIVKCRRQELDSDEVREHLKVGKQCFHLGLVFAERLSFVLGEDMVVRKPVPETATESLEGRPANRSKPKSTHLRADGGELRVLLERLETEFSSSARRLSAC